VNGVALSDGVVASNDGHTRANPFLFSAGSGGAAALTNLTVSAGEVLELDLIDLVRSADRAGDFVGVNLTVSEIVANAVVEPGIIALFCAALAGFATVRRRRYAEKATTSAA
jgi:hypothetical protein